MNHPNSLDLESFACGDELATVEAHLAECAACTTFVERLRGALSAGPSRARAANVVAKVAQRKVLAPVVRGPWLLRAASVAVPLAVAATLLFFLRAPQPEPERAAAPVVTSEPVAIVTPSSEPETTFKGGVQIAVVRERAGKQARFFGPVGVKPGDRLRVEVALDREQAILAAVMGDDASWLELMPEGVRQPGTHFSDRSARVDASPLRGTILVGPPAAMARAKSTKDFSGVSTLRIDWEGVP